MLYLLPDEHFKPAVYLCHGHHDYVLRYGHDLGRTGQRQEDRCVGAQAALQNRAVGSEASASNHCGRVQVGTQETLTLASSRKIARLNFYVPSV